MKLEVFDRRRVLTGAAVASTGLLSGCITVERYVFNLKVTVNLRRSNGTTSSLETFSRVSMQKKALGLFPAMNGWNDSHESDVIVVGLPRKASVVFVFEDGKSGPPLPSKWIYNEIARVRNSVWQHPVIHRNEYNRLLEYDRVIKLSPDQYPSAVYFKDNSNPYSSVHLRIDQIPGYADGIAVESFVFQRTKDFRLRDHRETFPWLPGKENPFSTLAWRRITRTGNEKDLLNVQ